MMEEGMMEGEAVTSQNSWGGGKIIAKTYSEI